MSTAASAAPATSEVPPPPPGFKSGLEGHIAFRTEIAEPDKDGGALRYRGVDIEDLVGLPTFLLGASARTLCTCLHHLGRVFRADLGRAAQHDR